MVLTLIELALIEAVILVVDTKWFSRGTLEVSGNKATVVPSLTLAEAQLSQLKEAAKDRMKTVRIRATVDKDASYWTQAFVKACAVYESSLCELMSVYFDSSGSFMGIAVTSTNPSCISKMDAPAKTFNTTVEVLTTAIGPAPDTKTYLQRLEQEKQEKMRGEKTDNRSFFAKYVSNLHSNALSLPSLARTASTAIALPVSDIAVTH